MITPVKRNQTIKFSLRCKRYKNSINWLIKQEVIENDEVFFIPMLCLFLTVYIISPWIIENIIVVIEANILITFEIVNIY